MSRFEFPWWTDKLLRLGLAAAAGGAAYVLALGWYGTLPTTINVGYQPEQPVAFSHRTHAGRLMLDCRYCHNTVERAAHAAVPPTATCGNCHSPANADGTVATASVHAASPKLQLVRRSLAVGEPIRWVRVHNLPDFVYFDHSAHVQRGVGCVTCHGRVDKMDRVYQAQPLTMRWCLECHRRPAPYLRPLDRVTDMTWRADDPEALGAELQRRMNIHPSTSCSTCHR